MTPANYLGGSCSREVAVVPIAVFALSLPNKAVIRHINYRISGREYEFGFELVIALEANNTNT